MNRYTALVVLVLIVHLIGCTVVTVIDSYGVCVALPTNTTVVNKEP